MSLYLWRLSKKAFQKNAHYQELTFIYFKLPNFPSRNYSFTTISNEPRCFIVRDDEKLVNLSLHIFKQDSVLIIVFCLHASVQRM